MSNDTTMRPTGVTVETTTLKLDEYADGIRVFVDDGGHLFVHDGDMEIGAYAAGMWRRARVGKAEWS